MAQTSVYVLKTGDRKELFIPPRTVPEVDTGIYITAVRKGGPVRYKFVIGDAAAKTPAAGADERCKGEAVKSPFGTSPGLKKYLTEQWRIYNFFKRLPEPVIGSWQGLLPTVFEVEMAGYFNGVDAHQQL